MKQRILIVDDERNILELLRYNLESAGYEVDDAMTGEACLEKAMEQPPDLILLDLMLPGMDGMETCKRLKSANETAQVPIIMLTAKSEEIDKVLGLELGADDYITKPFGVRELLARVKALLRRTTGLSQEASPVLQSRGLQMDTETYQAYSNGEKLQLTLKEFELLRFLLENKGKVITRDKLLDKIWGYEYVGESRTVDVHIRHLRQKLGEAGNAIETVRGIGYRFHEGDTT